MRIGVMMAAVLAGANWAWAQTAADRNAATWYQRAIEQFMQFRTASEADRNLLFDFASDLSTPVTPEIRAALARVQPILEMTRRGTAQEMCEFPLDRSQGFELALPHLSEMRGIARLMRADAAVRLNDGDASAAASAVADMYRMSGHFADDRIVISSLVGQAVFSFADGFAQYGLDRGAFGEAESQAMLDGLSRLSTNDPFDFLESVAGEKELAVGWLEQKYANVEDRGKLLEELGAWGGDELTNQQVAMLDEEGFHDALDQYDSLMNRVVEIFADPDKEAAKAAIKQLETELEHHMYGPLAQMLLPAFGKLLERRDQGEKMLADRLATLRALAGGKARPEDLANAALWYMRGIELTGKIDSEKRAAIRAFAADLAQPMPDDVAQTLAGAAVQEAIDVFRDGSTKRRCDFSMAKSRGEIKLYFDYQLGMHDAARLLRADAVRLLRAGETWVAVDRLALSLRMAGHLGNDPELLSCLIAHADFNTSLNFVERALKSGALEDLVKPGLADALERVSRKDPFGYIGAVLAARSAVTDRFGPPHVRADLDADGHRRWEAFGEDVKSLNGDQLLFLVAMIDTMQRNAASAGDKSAAPGSETIALLGDVMSLDDLKAAQELIPEAAPLLAQRSVAFLIGQRVPAIAASADGTSFSIRFHRARSDVRRAFMLLMAQPASNESDADDASE